MCYRIIVEGGTTEQLSLIIRYLHSTFHTLASLLEYYLLHHIRENMVLIVIIMLIMIIRIHYDTMCHSKLTIHWHKSGLILYKPNEYI